MRNFLIGLTGFAAGLSLAVIAGIAAGFSSIESGEAEPGLVALFAVGMFTMIAVPLAFWVVMPITGLIRRRRRPK